jgi:transglutaminase-like putative cysteine protease
MLISVSHQTRYRYDRPVRAVMQSHRLTPSVFKGQRTLQWQISVPDGMPGGSFRDGAGDAVQGWTVRGPVSEVVVSVQGQVETTDLAGVLDGHKEIIAPETYLTSTAATRPDAALTALSQVVNGDGGPLAAAHRLSAAVSAAIRYAPGATDAHTTAAEALAQGSGVCQDHAHAMIAAARVQGIPARYVSGYLFASADGSPHEAAHAWAEVWIAGLGWVGFDPANECCPDERYIRLGSGLDAPHAAPIKGIARGGGIEHLDVTVAVQATQQ